MTATDVQLSTIINEKAPSSWVGALLEGSMLQRPSPYFGRIDAANGPINRSFWGRARETPFCKKGFPAELLPIGPYRGVPGELLPSP